MPIVLRVGGFAFKCFLGDHEPPHVHVRYSGRKCRIVLSTLAVSKSDMNGSDEATAVRIVAAHREALNAAWTEVQEKGGER
jgi:hypothetical protein